MAKTFILDYNKACEKYSMHTSRFEGYVQGGIIHTAEHEEIGFTADRIKRSWDLVNNKNYAYSRQNNYGGISIYVRDNSSPTGVLLLGGIPQEFEWMIYAIHKSGQLSPTEDKRTAH